MININTYIDDFLNSLYTVNLSQNAPVCAHNFVSVASKCRSQTYPLSSYIFCVGKYRHMTFIDIRQSMCKNANERCYIDLLYYSYKYSHILGYNVNIMTNTKLHILAIVTCAYMLFA